MTNRPEFQTPPIYLRSIKELEYLKARLDHVPLDPEKPLEVIIQEQKKKRSVDLNAAYWAGPLTDIARDAWHNGQQFTAEQWHFRFKQLFLPDELAKGFDPRDVLKGYQKWMLDPWADSRILIGSTTQLSQRGMRKFVQEVEAYMSNAPYCVQFMERAS